MTTASRRLENTIAVKSAENVMIKKMRKGTGWCIDSKEPTFTLISVSSEHRDTLVDLDRRIKDAMNF